MKRIHSILFISFFTLSVSAQNVNVRKELTASYDKEQGELLLSQFQREYEIEREGVRLFLNNSKKEERGVFADGRVFQIKRIDESGLPLYYTTSNLESRRINQVDAIKEDLGVTLDGRNMIVGVWDGQVALDVHREFVVNGVSEVKLGDPISSLEKMTEKELKTNQKSRNHATHVVGTIKAKGVFNKAKGIAPNAKVVSFDWINDASEMAKMAKEGLLVSNHSYGIAAVDEDLVPLVPVSYFGVYNKEASKFDKVAYTYPYFQSVVSAGNDRLEFDLVNESKYGNDLLLGTANAKNVIVVAATGINDVGANEVADFSSFGPSCDFRIKPDIAANGVHVISSGYANPEPLTAEPSVVRYAKMSGTSMATPVVSGILTLWQQWAIENRQFPYKAATMKGIMVHSADYLTRKSPDNQIGWGVINAKKGVDLMINSLGKKAMIEERLLLNEGEFIQKFRLIENTNKLIVTLVWTDVEQDSPHYDFRTNRQAKALVNDLDLRVYKDGVVYLPWLLNKNYSDLRAVKGDNDVDNVEKIEIDNAEVGEYEIVVSHKGKLHTGLQDFSLLVSNDEMEGIYGEVAMPIVSENDFIIWPNPVEDIFNIEITKDKIFKFSQVDIYDLSNKLVKSVNVRATNRAVIDISELASGIYLMNIDAAGEKVRFKLAKK
ncbi:S8 family serine peptidase [Myroides phaeus]|uniref:Por secretion system C-terminal sorting domain-containing protein n=1 Tax=Myroides phaeus TaxID=702745 RepID=A0A1G8DN93_9FLAO|nr:S8 family serine peptidase [Myroides phaeus]SDH58979.1 Por secretion system C-terminal sorting domain-containing protein [Myroides phaeus]